MAFTRSARKIFDTPVVPRLENILEEVKAGDIAIPMFQRPFVWDDDRRIALLDSVAYGLPIGSLLVWRTLPQESLVTYDEIGGVRVAPRMSPSEKISYLIDGHQRISTLLGALSPAPAGTDPEGPRWPLYADLAATERPIFRTPPPARRKPPPTWLPLSLVLDPEGLFDFTRRLREGEMRELARQAERLANAFKDYSVPLVPLISDDLDEVTDAFVRINSQGKGMSEAHMLRALTWLKPTSTDERFDQIRERVADRGWGDLDDQVLVNTLKASMKIDIYGSSVSEIHQSLKVNPEPLELLSDQVSRAVELLASFGVYGSGALPYAFQLATLAVLPDAVDRLTDLERWFWATTYTEYYSGRSGSHMRQMIERLSAALLEGSALPYTPATEALTVTPLRTYKASTVRSKAFLLFLSRAPADRAARARRQACLGLGGEVTPKLFGKESASDPANRVIARPDELRALRAALEARQVTPELMDEYTLTPEAVALLPSPTRFLEARRRILAEREADFIRSWGLHVEPA